MIVQSPWYLASPYRKYPGGLDAAFDEVSRIAAAFTDAGVCVFSPITHSHPIARYTQIGAKDALWITLQRPFMHVCRGMIGCMMDGWAESEGMAEEARFFKGVGLPVVWIDTVSLLHSEIKFIKEMG